MAQKVILRVLESTIGKLVKNLDAESLNLAIWQGQIELHALELDIDAINVELARQAAASPTPTLPLRVVDGSFGGLQVDVPWTRLSSQSVVFRAKGLKLIVEPCNVQSMNVDPDRERMKTIRDERLKSLETANEYRVQANALRKLAKEEIPSGSSNENSTESASQASFSRRLMRRVIENIQFDMEDIHIALKGAGCVAAFSLDSFSFVTTDQDGERKFVDRQEKDMFLYKVLEINGLGIYLDELSPFAKSKAILEQRDVPEHSYLLSPLSFEAKLRQAMNVEATDVPKHLFRSELAQMTISLSKKQLELINKITQLVNPPRPLFPEYRPMSRVTKESAKEWWFYAFRCIGRLNGRRLWTEFFERHNKYMSYVHLYKRAAHHGTCPWLKPLSSEEEAQLEAIELDRAISARGIMLWRNVADAQAEREREVSEREKLRAMTTSSSYRILSPLFGINEDAKPVDVDEDCPPITLSAEELKELEALTLSEADEAELPQYSRFCDVQFVLGSLQVSLLSRGSKPLATLEMGTMTASFDANADGSFVHNLGVESWEITDGATEKTLFPTVVRNMVVDTDDSMEGRVFSFCLRKSSAGEQDVSLKMATFELVASPMLLLGAKEFFTSPDPSSARGGPKQIPVCALSSEGTLDLFYDADTSLADISLDAVATTEMISDKVSLRLIDAWKKKTEEKIKWTVNFDVHAPVLVIPENCTNLEANVLVFDFGDFSFCYGKEDADLKAKLSSRGQDGDNIDLGSLATQDFTFTIGRAGDLHWRLSKNRLRSSSQVKSMSTVIRPLSLSLDFGIQTPTAQAEASICLDASVHDVILSLSTSQTSKMLLVYASWSNVVSEITNDKPGDKTSNSVSDAITLKGRNRATNISSSEYSPIRRLSARHRSTFYYPIHASVKSTEEHSADGALTAIHGSLNLQRLSISLLSDAGEGIEANVVSVSVSALKKADGSANARVRIGWFWILDRFHSQLPRRQRLLVHSTLPRSAASFAQEGTYDILDTLHEQGVFDEDFSGSSELADITVKSAVPVNGGITEDNLFSSTDPSAVAHSVLDVKFASLYLHCNPRAIKVMVQAFSETFASLQDAYSSSVSTIKAIKRRASVHYTAAVHTFQRRASVQYAASSLISDVSFGASLRKELTNARKNTAINVELKQFKIFLNSARDDDELFVLEVSAAEVLSLSSEYLGENNTRVSVGLGDLRISTPAVSGTHPIYRTLLGPASGHSTSLLSINCYMGDEAVEACLCESAVRNLCDTCNEVSLSPMRLVYIHAQWMMLVEYLADGVPGAMATDTTSPKAEKDVEKTESCSFLEVNAVGVEVLFPQSADTSDHVALGATRIQVTNRNYPGPEGGATRYSVSGITMKDSENRPMLKAPAQLAITFATTDDESSHTTYDISQAAFLWTHSQYQQLAWIIERNFCEKDPCLRGTSEDEMLAKVTHTGVVPVVKSDEPPDEVDGWKVDYNLSDVSFEFCDCDPADPIMFISVVEAVIANKFVPGVRESSVEVKLRSLRCEDRRLKAMGRPFHALVEQVNGTTDDDFFYVIAKTTGEDTYTEIVLSSPRVMLIPDVIAEMMSYFETEPKERVDKVTQSQATDEREPLEGEQVVEVQVDENSNAVEAVFASLLRGEDSEDVKNSTFSITTGHCSLGLVDMGIASLGMHANETVILQGRFVARASHVSELASGRLVTAEAELRGESMEIYTAHGSTFSSPIQIMEPASVSACVTLKSGNGNMKKLDVRIITLSPFDITFSMQNAALVYTIVYNCANYFNADETDQSEDGSLSYTAREKSLPPARESVLAPAHDGKSKNEVVILSCFQVTIKETKLTIVNDLQGVEEPLFRCRLDSFNLDIKARSPSRLLQDTTFDTELRASLLADYFDSSVQLWVVFLEKPWDLRLKSTRDDSVRSFLGRMSTEADFEASPCHISFSEQFMVSLSAASNMWAVYATAMEKAAEGGSNAGSDENNQVGVISKKDTASSAIGQLITSLPYAVENHSGVDIAFRLPRSGERYSCASGSIQYFRFKPPQGMGTGGHRQYGQDVTSLKALTLFVYGETIEIKHLDSELIKPRHVHDLGKGRYLVMWTVKEGRTAVLHLSSSIEIYNCTSVPFRLSVAIDDNDTDIGVCASHQGDKVNLAMRKPTIDSLGDSVSDASRLFGVPLDLLCSTGISRSLRISPGSEGILSGSVNLPSLRDAVIYAAHEHLAIQRFVVTCHDSRQPNSRDNFEERPPDPFSLQIWFRATLIDNVHPFVEIFLGPRIVLENKMPVGLKVRTPMPHTFKGGYQLKQRKAVSNEKGQTSHELLPGEIIEVYTPGPSIALIVKCSEQLSGSSDWLEGNWIEIPLARERCLPGPLMRTFPFVQKKAGDQAGQGSPGSFDFFVAESGDNLADLLLNYEDRGGEQHAADKGYSGIEVVDPGTSLRKIWLTVCNYAVDHTGNILFELAQSERSVPWKATPDFSLPPFLSSAGRHRITLLPHGKTNICIFEQAKQVGKGSRHSQPFCIDNISICDGGVESTLIRWKDNSESGYYAYRRLIDTYQFEVHFIPEFVVFNGSTIHNVLVREQGGRGNVISPRDIAPIRGTSKHGLVISVVFVDFDGSTAALRVDSLGFQVATVTSLEGSPLGRVAVQTVMGGRDSKLVVKIGELEKERARSDTERSRSLFVGDVMKLRVKCPELQVTLNEVNALGPGQKNVAFVESGIEYMEGSQLHMSSMSSLRESSRRVLGRVESCEEPVRIERQPEVPVCSFLLRKLHLDWKRMFNEGEYSQKELRDALLSPERSQLSAIIHTAQVFDKRPEADDPVIFDSTSAPRFFDLCVRYRGARTAELITVELFELNLGHSLDKSYKIILQTTEDFVWKAIDVANRILVSTAALSGNDLILEWNEQAGGFVVSLADRPDTDKKTTYTPPKIETLYDVERARIAPFEMEVSFTRRPQTSRYPRLQHGGPGAAFLNYLIERLKFRIDRADLHFACYEVANFKGPPDRLRELLLSVLISRLKSKIVSVVRAIRIDDWKGDEEEKR